MTTSKGRDPEGRSRASAGELAMRTRQFVTFLGGTWEVEFQDDPKRKVSATSRPPLTFVLRFVIVATEVFEERLNRR
jgi:hypothetical protein